MPLRVQPSPSVWLVERGSPVPPLVASPMVPVSVSLIFAVNESRARMRWRVWSALASSGSTNSCR